VVWICGCSGGWNISAGPEVEAEDFEDASSRGIGGGGRGSGDFEDEAVATVVQRGPAGYPQIGADEGGEV